MCVCALTRGADNSQQTVWCKAAWLGQGGLLSSRGPKAFVYEPGQSTEQQEAFCTIVRARWDYERFKWSQAESSRNCHGQKIVKLLHRLPTFGNQGGQEIGAPLLKPARSEIHKTVIDLFWPCCVTILRWSHDLWEWTCGLYWAFNCKLRKSCLTYGNVSEGWQWRNVKTTFCCWGQNEWATSQLTYCTYYTVIHVYCYIRAFPYLFQDK